MDQQRHLLIHVQQMAFSAVFNGRFVHNAGVDAPDGVLQLLQAFFPGALVHAEHRLVLSGEGVSVTVLHDAAGAHNDRKIAVVVQHLLQLSPDVLRDFSVLQPPCQLLRLLEMLLFQLVPGLQLGAPV